MKIGTKNRLAVKGFAVSCGYLLARNFIDRPLGLSNYLNKFLEGAPNILNNADLIMYPITVATMTYVLYRQHKSYENISENPHSNLRHYYRQLDGFLISMSAFPWYRGVMISSLLNSIGPQHKTLLSLGGGSGRIENEIEKKGIHVIAVDISCEDLGKYKIRNTSAECIVADAESLPLRKDSVDVVLSNESIGHMHLSQIFLESNRVLREGGTIQVSTYSDSRLNNRHLSILRALLVRCSSQSCENRGIQSCSEKKIPHDALNHSSAVSDGSDECC